MLIMSARHSLIGFTKYYKCLSGCILTLKVELVIFGKIQLFMFMVISTGSRRDGDGSDHGLVGKYIDIPGELMGRKW